MSPLPWRRWLSGLLVAVALSGGLLSREAAAQTKPPVAPGTLPARPNSVPVVPHVTRGPTNLVAARGPGGKTNAITAGAKKGGTNAPGLLERVKTLPSQKAFYPVVIGLVVALIAALVFRMSKGKAATVAAPADAPITPARPILKKAGKQNFQSCSILQVTPNARKIWQFDSKFNLSRDLTSPVGESLPSSTVKDWRSLWQKKLNIAWLPSESVFLRVAQFPASNFDETISMVELQLEKLSPMPVAQIVWSLEVIPHADGKMQTVIVMIISRNVVEEFLGKLEGQGFMADRLELPLLDQLQATKVTENGAWLFPEPTGGRNAALVAWWYGGVLQNLNLVTLPAEDRVAGLKEQLLQMAWAGEMEGWLTSPPRWHLAGDSFAVAEWEGPLREALSQPLEIIAPVPPATLAARTARRVAQSEPAANLLPVEFATKYRQQFVDRLWMKGLGAVLGLYLLGLIVYAVAVTFASYRTEGVETQAAQLGPTYTNVIQLRAKLAILKERQDLKFAGLDCWKAVAELMPDTVTLDGMNFFDGKRLTLNGTAPADSAPKLTEFDSALRKKRTSDGQPLFETFGENLTWQLVGGGTISWRVTLDLKRTEAL